MRRAIELSNVHDIILIFEHRSFVVVDIQVVGSAEYCHDTGEARCSGLPIHAIPSILCFMGADDRKKIVLFEECTRSWVREEVGAPSDVVVDEVFASLFLAKLFEWVGPENVAHKPVSGRLAESINLSSQYCRTLQ